MFKGVGIGRLDVDFDIHAVCGRCRKGDMSGSLYGKGACRWRAAIQVFTGLVDMGVIRVAA